MKTIAETLAEREQQHGNFDCHCHIEAQLRQLVFDIGTESLDNTQAIGLGMILHKIARILNKGNLHADTWHDIAGYATLVEKHVVEINTHDARIKAEQHEIANER